MDDGDRVGIHWRFTDGILAFPYSPTCQHCLLYLSPLFSSSLFTSTHGWTCLPHPSHRRQAEAFSLPTTTCTHCTAAFHYLHARALLPPHCLPHNIHGCLTCFPHFLLPFPCLFLVKHDLCLCTATAFSFPPHYYILKFIAKHKHCIHFGQWRQANIWLGLVDQDLAGQGRHGQKHQHGSSRQAFTWDRRDRMEGHGSFMQCLPMWCCMHRHGGAVTDRFPCLPLCLPPSSPISSFLLTGCALRHACTAAVVSFSSSQTVSFAVSLWLKRTCMPTLGTSFPSHNSPLLLLLYYTLFLTTTLRPLPCHVFAAFCLGKHLSSWWGRQDWNRRRKTPSHPPFPTAPSSQHTSSCPAVPRYSPGVGRSAISLFLHFLPHTHILPHTRAAFLQHAASRRRRFIRRNRRYAPVGCSRGFSARAEPQRGDRRHRMPPTGHGAWAAGRKRASGVLCRCATAHLRWQRPSLPADGFISPLLPGDALRCASWHATYTFFPGTPLPPNLTILYLPPFVIAAHLLLHYLRRNIRRATVAAALLSAAYVRDPFAFRNISP